MSFAKKVYAIKPQHFYLNQETALDNKFMHTATIPQDMLQDIVNKEYEEFVEHIQANKVGITVFN